MSNARFAYDRLRSTYDTLTKGLDRLALNRMRRQLLETNATGRVLEVGIGTGKNLAFYPAKLEITGLDISSKSIDVARQRAVDQNIRFERVVADAISMPFDDAMFDTVVMTMTACQFDGPSARRVFREMRRVCRPEGKILFLEHRPPESISMTAIFYASWPLAKVLLNCNPLQDNLELLGDAGIDAVSVETGANGAIHAVVALPA